jgi:fibronectin type 3 domain-containing protein
MLAILLLFSLFQLPQAPSVKLAWKASISPNVGSYRVLRSNTAGGPYVRIRLGITGTSYVDKAVVAGETYYYVVRADCATCDPAISKNSNQAQAIVP